MEIAAGGRGAFGRGGDEADGEVEGAGDGVEEGGVEEGGDAHEGGGGWAGWAGAGHLRWKVGTLEGEGDGAFLVGCSGAHGK